MRPQKVAFAVVIGIVALQLVALLILGIIVYQATPKSILARDTIVGRMPVLLALARVADRSFNMFYWGPAAPEPLPRYTLRIDPAAYSVMERSLPTQLTSPYYGNLFLTDEAKGWMDGTFVADGEQYDVQVRVRGDIFNHWAYRKKSWRVKFPSEKPFNGMSELSLIIPEDRGWIAEPLNVYRAKKFGLLHPPMRFVTLSLNGSTPMLYTEVEHWTKEMLEKLAHPGDSNLYETSGATSYYEQWDPVFDTAAYWQKYETSFASPLDSYEEIDELLELSQEGAHEDPLYLRKLETLFDVEELVSWQALSLLAGSRHVSEFNFRMYFDNSLGRFTPIPWDTSLYNPRSLFALPGNPFLNEVFRVPEHRLWVYRTLWEYVNDAEQVQDDLKEATRLRTLAEGAAYRDSMKLPSNRQVKREFDMRMGQVQSNIDFLKEELKRSEVLSVQRISTNAEQDQGLLLTIDLTARGPAPATLAGLTLSPEYEDAVNRGSLRLWRDDGDGVWDSGDARIPLVLSAEETANGNIVAHTEDHPQAQLWLGDAVFDEFGTFKEPPNTQHRFYLTRSDDAVTHPGEVRLRLHNAVTGERIEPIAENVVDERTFEYLLEALLDRAAFLRNNPSFRLSEFGVSLGGTVTFQRNVIIPPFVGRLIIDPGTTVQMGSGVSILSYAPVTIDGSAESPVRVRALTPGVPWGVFAVLHAEGGAISGVTWAEFSDGGQAFLNGTFFTGMLAFHGSPVIVADSIFRNAHGDDGLNIKYVEADIRRSVFLQNDFDGLDIDVAPLGSVENSEFIDNGGDGLDLSWSSIAIRRVTVRGSGDKCISVGESSAPTIEDSVLQGCAMGIAVKDSSRATVKNTTFIGNDIAVAAYIKKPFFSAPSVTISQSTFEGNDIQTQALSGATISIE